MNRPDGLGQTRVLIDRDLDAKRFPSVHLLDLRLQKRLALGRIRATLDLDLFNALNTDSTLRQFGDAITTTFGQSSGDRGAPARAAGAAAAVLTQPRRAQCLEQGAHRFARAQGSTAFGVEQGLGRSASRDDYNCGPRRRAAAIGTETRATRESGF